MKIIGRLFLFLILLAVIAVGGAYAYLNNDPWSEKYNLDLNGPEETISPFDLISYDADTKDFLITVGQKQIANLISTNEMLHQTLESLPEDYGVNVEKIGYEMDDDGNLCIYISAKYKNLIPAHLCVVCEYTVEDFTFTASAKEVKLGSKITVAYSDLQEKFGLSDATYSFTVDVSEYESLVGAGKLSKKYFEFYGVKDGAIVYGFNAKNYFEKVQTDFYNNLNKKAQELFRYNGKTLEGIIEEALRAFERKMADYLSSMGN